MERQEEQVIRLEERVRAERERTDYHLAHFHSRLSRLEERTIGVNSSALKLMLAVGVTLLAFLVSGDPRAAMSAAKIGLGLF
jgi:hypothetical protein